MPFSFCLWCFLHPHAALGPRYEVAKQGKCALCGAPSFQITTGARRCHGKLSAIRPVRSTKQASPLRQTAPLPWQIPAASWKGIMPLADSPLLSYIRVTPCSFREGLGRIVQTSRQTHLRQARGALVDAILASSPGGSRRSDASLQAPILARHRNEKREETLHSGHFEPLLVLIRFVESGHGGQRRAHRAPGGGAGLMGKVGKTKGAG